MKRRTFLAAATTATAITTLPPLRFAAAAPDGDGPPLVAVRNDLTQIAPTVGSLPDQGSVGGQGWGEPIGDHFTTLYDLDTVDEVGLWAVHDGSTLLVGVAVTGAAARTVTHVSVLVRDQSGHCSVATVEVRQPTLPVTFEWGDEVGSLDHTATTTPGDDTTMATVEIALASVGIDDPEGAELRLNVVVDQDDQTGPALSSTPTRLSVNRRRNEDNAVLHTAVVNEDRFARIHLGATPAARNGRDAELVSTEAALEYVGFTRKRLRFTMPGGTVRDEFRIDWRAPGEDWTELAVTARPGREWTAEFDHQPPQTRGQYEIRISALSRSGNDRVAVLTFDREALIAAGDQLPANLPRPPRGTDPVEPEPASPEVEKLIALVPERAGFTFCGVPDAPELHPNKTFTFDIDQPDQIVAVSTGTVYPNADHPEDQELVVRNGREEEVSYPYHQDDSGKRYFLSAHLWYLQRTAVWNSLVPLADRDPLGAARLLHRVAQVYPGWVPTNEYPWFNRPIEAASTPRNHYWGGSLTRWSPSDLVVMEQIGQAFQTVEQTDAFDVLSDELDLDVRSMVLDEFIHPAVEWSRTFPWTYNNMEPSSHRGRGQLARALGDSSHAHEVIEWAAEFARLSFLFDGFWKETTVSYHNQSAGGAVQVANAVKGWSDATEYESPRSGQRVEDLDLLELMPVVGAALRVPTLTAYPDSHVLPVADTWASERSGNPDRDTGSFVLGASGISRLSRGRISGVGPFGIVSWFENLEVTDQSAEVQFFAGSRTMQVEATAVGAEVTWGFSVETADSYDLDLLPFHAGSYGVYEILVDDVVLGEHDFHADASGVAEAFTVERVELSAGDHTITFRCTGKSDSSSNYKMGVCWLALLDSAAREDRDSAGDPSANPSQLWLMNTPKYGHNHWDPLSINLWAEGQELLPDIGYTHTRFGRWTLSTLAHNTVTVDSDNMSSAGADAGSYEIFDNVTEDVQVIRADHPDAYSQASLYQREVWSIALPGSERDESYVLDLFRVRGGERHEYSLNGDANRDAEMTTSAALQEYGPYLLPEGVEVVEPVTETDEGSAEGHYHGYIHVKDVQRAELGDGSFDLHLTTSEEDNELSGLRILGQAGAGTELFLGRSPSMRATRLRGTAGDVNTEADKWTMPKLVLRREGSELDSTFVAVLEPTGVGVAARIESVELIDHDGGDDDLAVRVTHVDGTVDVVLSVQSDQDTVTAAGVTLTGKLGWARLSGDELVAAHLVGGASLAAGGQTLTDDGPVTGGVTGTRRRMVGDDLDALEVDSPVPDWCVGRTVIVTHPDGKSHPYPILAVADGLIELDQIDPGFTVDGDSSEMVFTPFTQWEGPTTYRIENSIHH